MTSLGYLQYSDINDSSTSNSFEKNKINSRIRTTIKKRHSDKNSDSNSISDQNVKNMLNIINNSNGYNDGDDDSGLADFNPPPRAELPKVKDNNVEIDDEIPSANIAITTNTKNANKIRITKEDTYANQDHDNQNDDNQAYGNQTYGAYGNQAYGNQAYGNQSYDNQNRANRNNKAAANKITGYFSDSSPASLDVYENAGKEGFKPSPAAYANSNQFGIPLYNQINYASGNKDELLEKLNYMIHLLEEQKDEKTGHVMEEVILYSFLGVFIIFIVDSFARAGKYTR